MNSGVKGWEGAQVNTVCGNLGPLLGGYSVLGDRGYLRKTYTNLCRHNSVNIQFGLVAIDGWEGETISLYVDGAEVGGFVCNVCIYVYIYIYLYIYIYI